MDNKEKELTPEQIRLGKEYMEDWRCLDRLSKRLRESDEDVHHIIHANYIFWQDLYDKIVGKRDYFRVGGQG